MRPAALVNRSWSRALLVALLTSVVALAGCVGGGSDNDEDEAKGDKCEEGDGVLELHIVEGAWDQGSSAWYEPANPVLDGIHTLCWVNDDSQWHKILAFPSATGVDTTPAWVQEAMEMSAAGGGGHNHGGGGGGHDHGGGGGDDHSAATPLFDIEIMPKERVAMAVTEDMNGILDVHCHPHPWMVSAWTVIPGQAVDYPVEVASVVYYGGVNDEALTVGTSTDVPLALDAPNLATVQVTVTWEDREDVGPTGAQSNNPDTFLIQLKDVAGEVVADTTATERDGEVTLETTIEQAWPATVAGRGQTAAAQNLTSSRPDDAASSGTWTVTVTLVSAPGPIPDTDGATAQAQAATDGKEAFDLAFTATHTFGKVLPQGATPSSGAAPAADVPV